MLEVDVRKGEAELSILHNNVWRRISQSNREGRAEGGRWLVGRRKECVVQSGLKHESLESEECKKKDWTNLS